MTLPQKPPEVKKFLIILDAWGGGELTSVVPREVLLEALDDYTAKGRRWLVTKA